MNIAVNACRTSKHPVQYFVPIARRGVRTAGLSCTFGAAPAAEQEMAWPSACNANVVVDCLPRLLCHFEANRLSRFLLSDRCPINGGSMDQVAPRLPIL